MKTNKMYLLKNGHIISLFIIIGLFIAIFLGTATLFYKKISTLENFIDKGLEYSQDEYGDWVNTETGESLSYERWKTKSLEKDQDRLNEKIYALGEYLDIYYRDGYNTFVDGEYVKNTEFNY
jgi:hypothetical protein